MHTLGTSLLICRCILRSMKYGYGSYVNESNTEMATPTVAGINSCEELSVWQ